MLKGIYYLCNKNKEVTKMTDKAKIANLLGRIDGRLQGIKDDMKAACGKTDVVEEINYIEFTETLVDQIWLELQK
jgi:hypothetical protein